MAAHSFCVTTYPQIAQIDADELCVICEHLRNLRMKIAQALQQNAGDNRHSGCSNTGK